MKRKITIAAFFIFLVLATYCLWVDRILNFPVKEPTEHLLKRYVPMNIALRNSSQDDLDWLIGKWRCIIKEYLAPPFVPMDSRDNIEYFNVYLPYVDTNLTLTITSNPLDRWIAAELVCMTDYNFDYARFGTPRDSLPMSIGKEHIGAGYPEPNMERWKYSLVTNYYTGNGVPFQLVLETKRVRIVFEKVGFRSEEDLYKCMAKSFIDAPVKNYSPTQLSLLKARYEELKRNVTTSP